MPTYEPKNMITIVTYSLIAVAVIWFVTTLNNNPTMKWMAFALVFFMIAKAIGLVK